MDTQAGAAQASWDEIKVWTIAGAANQNADVTCTIRSPFCENDPCILHLETERQKKILQAANEGNDNISKYPKLQVTALLRNSLEVMDQISDRCV